MSGSVPIIVEYQTVEQICDRASRLPGMISRDVLDVGIYPEGVVRE